MEKTIKVKLTLTEAILGTLPGDSEIYRNYLASKNPNPETIDDEVDAIDRAANQLSADEEFEKSCTVFARNEAGDACIYDYLIKGFFKNACKALRETDAKCAKLSAYKTKIDNCIFVAPRMIEINHLDSPITICERPLRASTAQGERIALAASEQIDAGATLEFEVTCLDDKFMPYVEEWLNYGKYNGLGQWHNSGKGRFTWEEIK